MTHSPSDGGDQETLALDVELIQGWLFMLDTNRVKPELRDTLLTYQRECFKALHDYWTKGLAVNDTSLKASLSYDPSHENSTDLVAASWVVLAKAVQKLSPRQAPVFINEATTLLLKIHNAPVTELKHLTADQERLTTLILSTGTDLTTNTIHAITRHQDAAKIVRSLRERGVPIVKTKDVGRCTCFTMMRT